MRNTAKATHVMTKAWAEARRGQAIYGGSVRQYIAAALRLVWAEYKAHPVTRIADAMIAEIKARKAAGTHIPPAPYCVRNRGQRAMTSWFAGQRTLLTGARP